MEVGHELAAVQMTPAAFRAVVIERELPAALRAGPPYPFRMLGPDIDPLFCHFEFNSPDRPRRFKAQQVAIELDVAHRSDPPLEGGVYPTPETPPRHATLPTENPDGAK